MFDRTRRGSANAPQHCVCLCLRVCACFGMLVLSFPRYVSLCIPLCLSLCDSLCVPLSVSRFFVHGSTSFVVLSCFVCIESCATTMAGFSQYLPRLSCARVAAAGTALPTFGHCSQANFQAGRHRQQWCFSACWWHSVCS